LSIGRYGYDGYIRYGHDSNRRDRSRIAIARHSFTPSSHSEDVRGESSRRAIERYYRGSRSPVCVQLRRGEVRSLPQSDKRQILSVEKLRKMITRDEAAGGRCAINRMHVLALREPAEAKLVEEGLSIGVSIS
jgi:hypothetical protein